MPRSFLEFELAFLDYGIYTTYLQYRPRVGYQWEPYPCRTAFKTWYDMVSELSTSGRDAK